MAERATITTVAKHSKVSPQTVSNVLNAPHLVREETRVRVLASIEALGYRANQAARQMRTGRSRLIAVRIEPAQDGINGAVLDRFLHGLTESASAAGYRIMLYTAANDTDEIATYDELLAAHELDAFVLTSTHHGDSRTAWLAEHGVPFVTFGRPWDAPESHSWVDIDGAAGTAAATRHLLESGHRRIAFIGWPEGSGVGDDRRAGWHIAMREAKLAVSGMCRSVPDGADEGEQAALDLLAGFDPPTAFVCASDSLALGALRAAGRVPAPQTPASARRHSHAPIGVTGFDDTAAAQVIGMTSVSQPLAEAARRCIHLLTRLLHTRPGKPESGGKPPHILLSPSLVIRASG
jgi:DNA-binding LacI/PurR family transcriptional regulator